MAHSVVRVSSDYKIQTDNGHTIWLDTGLNAGQVYVTGDLVVQGNTTTVNTTNMVIEDNIILLNKGEIGAGVTEFTAGIEIDRGVAARGNAQILWNENMVYRDPSVPYPNNIKHGLWVFQTKDGDIVSGIRTNCIDTDGKTLNLISSDGSSTIEQGIVSVKGTTDYERRVLNYNNGLIAFDDDTIPNMKAVDDKIDYQILNNPSNKIKRDDTQVVVYDNVIKINSFSTLGSNTEIICNHPLVANSEFRIAIGNTVTLSGTGILGLDGTWPIIDAVPQLEFFKILITTSLTLSNVPNVGTVTINNKKSNIQMFVDGVLYGEMQSTHADFYSLRLQDTTITTTISDTDLILASPGTGSVQIQDNLKLSNVGLVPSNPPSGTLKIYSNPEGPGGTGIYFVNDVFATNVGDNRRDELISKKKAIAFSILM